MGLPLPCTHDLRHGECGDCAGPAMATFTALGDLGTGAGPMLMGIILEWTSYPVMFLCLILFGVTNFVYFHYAIWKEAKDIREEGRGENRT